jgi:hypothetical protein
MSSFREIEGTFHAVMVRRPRLLYVEMAKVRRQVSASSEMHLLQKEESTLNRLLFALVAPFAFVAPAVAAPSDPLMVPIHQFVDGFNDGNVKNALAAFAAAGVAIIDDVSPHVWTGPKAMATWVKDLTAAESKAGITGGTVTLGNPTRELSEGARAYVVVPSIYHFSQHGKPLHEAAHVAFALQKVAGTWLIAGWTWAGSTPQQGK